MSENKGFTLVELLIVIAIISILSTIGMAVYGNVQQNARDTKRRGDIDSIAAALEQKYNSYIGQYPAVDDTFKSAMFPQGFPQDPKNQDPYLYKGIPPAAVNTFTICAKLENNNGNASDTSGTAASGANAIYYCRSKLQGG